MVILSLRVVVIISATDCAIDSTLALAFSEIVVFNWSVTSDRTAFTISSYEESTLLADDIMIELDPVENSGNLIFFAVWMTFEPGLGVLLFDIPLLVQLLTGVLVML